MISSIHSSLSALLSFGRKVESVADNTANINTDGFKKTKVTLQEAEPQGVKASTRKVETPGPLVYEQTPDGEKLVEKSNVELTEELPELMLTKNYFKANIKVIQAEDEMLGSILDIKG